MGYSKMETVLPQDIKGILFDLDGTLYRMKWFMKPLFAVMLFPDSLMLPRYMKIRKEFAGREMGNGERLLQAMAEKLSLQCSKDVQHTVSWIHNRFYKAFDSIMPLLRGSRPGINNTLAGLKKKGYKLAVVSDFAHISQRLAGLGIDHSLFDRLISSEEEGSLKPCHRCLATIADSWNIKPLEMVVIGDRSDTDGGAASNAGMHFIKIFEKNPAYAHSFSWTDVQQYLNNLPAIAIP